MPPSSWRYYECRVFIGTACPRTPTNGNLLTRTDARGLGFKLTVAPYDGLNRPTSKSYSDGTPTVNFAYDNVSKGRLTSISSTVSATNFTQYDDLGRIKTSSQVTDGLSYTFAYAYNVDGTLQSQTYPSNRVVNYGYDGAGRPENAAAGATSYASSIDYAPHGAVSDLSLGNGRFEQSCFNSRLQPTGMRIGSIATTSNCSDPGDLLNLGFTYGGTNNNGNLLSQVISQPGVGLLTQTYGYDDVNRLESATEAPTSWTRGYGYDRYGNRWLSSANHHALDGDAHRAGAVQRCDESAHPHLPGHLPAPRRL